MSAKRFYIKKSLINAEEDEYNEFKGHRSIGIEDLPPWCFQPNSNRRTRKPASRTINAFLNSGRGGTLYLGIIDEGVVKGFYLTEFQKDHIIVAIKDLLSRYEPKVNEDRYEIEFVPIFEKDEKKNNRVDQQYENIENRCVEKHLKPHLLRTYDFCWCDKDLARRIDENIRPQDYVVEIKIHKQKTTFNIYSDISFKVALPITYQNEEGVCFFRKSASCKEYSLKACQELALQQLRDIYEPVMLAMRNELEYLLVQVDETKIHNAKPAELMNTKVNETRMQCNGNNVCKEISDYLEQFGLISKKNQIKRECDILEENEETNGNIINNICKELGIVLEEDDIFKSNYSKNINQSSGGVVK